MLYNMTARLLVKTRVVYRTNAFAELVLWAVPLPVTGSVHAFKYRLAYVVSGVCVLRFDNEAGKGDHRHFEQIERRYRYTTPDRLIADFQADIARWDGENSDP